MTCANSRPAARNRVVPETVEIRSTTTGHRLFDSRTGGQPAETRTMPPWVWPFELAARVRARMARRYG